MPTRAVPKSEIPVALPHIPHRPPFPSITKQPAIVRLFSTLHPPSTASASPPTTPTLPSPPTPSTSLRAATKPVRGVVSMRKKSSWDLSEADLMGKRVFARADLNVPLDANQNITDDTSSYHQVFDQQWG